MEGQGGEASRQARRAEALRRANQVRRCRAEVKRDLQAGKVSIGELLTEPPEFLRGALLAEILRAAPGYGRVRVDRLLTRCAVSSLRTLGELTERERQALLAVLGEA